jgi:hypothetical protein
LAEKEEKEFGRDHRMNRKRNHPVNPVIQSKTNRRNQKILNHGWTPMNTDKRFSETIPEPSRNISVNQCVSVVKKSRANRVAGS